MGFRMYRMLYLHFLYNMCANGFLRNEWLIVPSHIVGMWRFQLCLRLVCENSNRLKKYIRLHAMYVRLIYPHKHTNPTYILPSKFNQFLYQRTNTAIVCIAHLIVCTFASFSEMYTQIEIHFFIFHCQHCIRTDNGARLPRIGLLARLLYNENAGSIE